MTPATIKVLLSHLLRIPFSIDCRLQTHPFGCSATLFYLYNHIIALFYSTVKVRQYDKCDFIIERFLHIQYIKLNKNKSRGINKKERFKRWIYVRSI